MGGSGYITGHTISIAATANLAPSGSAGAVGNLKTGNVSLATGSNYLVEIDGDVDELDVTGTVNLAGANLVVTSIAPPTAGALTIIDNDGTDPIVGTFDGLAEGETVMIDGDSYYIIYDYDVETGSRGNGNDIALVDNIPPILSLGASSASVEVGSAVSVTLTYSDPDDDLLEWLLDWGDGATSWLGGDSLAATHVYALAGTFALFAQVTGSSGQFAQVQAASPLNSTETEDTRIPEYKVVLGAGQSESSAEHDLDNFGIKQTGFFPATTWNEAARLALMGADIKANGQTFAFPTNFLIDTANGLRAIPGNSIPGAPEIPDDVKMLAFEDWTDSDYDDRYWPIGIISGDMDVDGDNNSKEGIPSNSEKEEEAEDAGTAKAVRISTAERKAYTPLEIRLLDFTDSTSQVKFVGDATMFNLWNDNPATNPNAEPIVFGTAYLASGGELDLSSGSWKTLYVEALQAGSGAIQMKLDPLSDGSFVQVDEVAIEASDCGCKISKEDVRIDAGIQFGVPAAAMKWMTKAPQAPNGLNVYTLVNATWTVKSSPTDPIPRQGSYKFWIKGIATTNMFQLNLSPQHGSHRGTENKLSPWPIFDGATRQERTVQLNQYLKDSFNLTNGSGELTVALEYRGFSQAATEQFNPKIPAFDEKGGPFESPQLAPDSRNPQQNKPYAPNRFRTQYRTTGDWTDNEPANWANTPEWQCKATLEFNWDWNRGEDKFGHFRLSDDDEVVEDDVKLVIQPA